MMSSGEEKYLTIFNETSDGILLMNDEGNLTDVNRSLCNLLDFTREELLKMNIADLIDPKQLKIDTVALAPIMNSEQAIRRWRLQKKDTSVIEMEVNVKRVSENLMIAIGRNITELRAGNIEDVTERKRAEAELKKINHDMEKRVKELNCLYRISELVSDAEKSMESILQELVHIIPPSYQYPEITTARITFMNSKFKSENFSESIWNQATPIKINKAEVGLVEVFYTQQMPELYEGPFLKEERALINSVADIVGSAAERKKAEAYIREQAETFRAIIESTKESIYLISPDYKVLIFNNTARERIRKNASMEITIGTDFRQYLFPDTLDIFSRMFEDSLKGIYCTEEIKAKEASGDFFWFRSQTSPVYGLTGELIGVRVLVEGINDRKNAEALLRESEEKFRSIVEHSLVGIYIIQDEKLVYVNPGFEKIFGYTKKQLLNKMSFDDLVHRDDVEKIRKRYTTSISRKKIPSQYLFRATKHDGSILHLEAIVSLIKFNNHPAVIGTLIDNTNRIEEEKRVNQAVLDAQERERLQIGMELHDNVQQILVGCGLFLDIARENLDDEEALATTLNELKKYNLDAIDELRRLSHQLAPLVESDSLLYEKIDWLIQSLKMDGKLSLSVHIDEFEKPLDNNTQLAFYRILQELLSNILKYAGASSAEINIRVVNREVLLQVSDNGKGFDSKKTKEGIGLENIRRRAEMMGGKVEIITAPGEGCKVNVHVPVASW